ncbi:hypothetical protein [Actinophytocola sp.]|uniref:hypothetical protein n=1 Tax=Actinophytocola sp. TaxID=1872138 RepID=UPI00389983D3
MTATYRLPLLETDPDQACHVLCGTNAAIDWDDDPTRVSARLGDCRVEVFAEPCRLLLITGPSNDAVGETANQLGYCHGTITEIKYGVATRPPIVSSR